MQVLLAVAVSLAGIAVVWWFGDPAYRATACLLTVAIAPLLVSSIPALANVAAEDFSRNVPGALLGLLAYAVTVALTLALGWGLVGLAAAVLCRRVTEMSVRLWPALQWMRGLPKVKVPEGLYRKVFAFSGQALAITMLMVVVWDRSELVFLKQFSSISQLAFFTVAFGLTEQILMLPNVFGGAVGAALMADYALTPETAGRRAAGVVRYLSLLVFPIHVGLAVLSSPVIRIAYGAAYLPAIPVLSIVLLLGISKAFHWLPWAIYQAADRQMTMIRWLLLAAAVKIGLDIALIPGFGAVGAGLANGLSQTFAVFAMWPAAARLCHFNMPWNSMFRIAVSAAAMGAIVVVAVVLLQPWLALVCGVPLGCLVYGALLRLTRVIGPQDVRVAEQMAGRLPAPIRRPALSIARLLSTPAPCALEPAPAGITPVV